MKKLNLILAFLYRLYDKIILGILLLVLIIVLVNQTKNLKATQSEVNQADQDLQKKLPTNKILPINDSEYKINIQVDSQKIWKDNYSEGTLVDPGNYVFSMDGSPYLLHLSTPKNPYTDKPDLPPTDSKTDSKNKVTDIEAIKQNLLKSDDDSDKDGIPDSIEDQEKLNKNNPKDAQDDNDGDGFTNLEEYINKSSINAEDSHPPLALKLRLIKKFRNQLPIILKKINVNNEPYNKNAWDLEIRYESQGRWKSDFLKIGKLLPGTDLKVIDASYKEVIKDKIPEEESSIIIRKNNEIPITMKRNQTLTLGDDSYELAYLLKMVKLKITVNEILILENLKNNKEEYKVIDANDDEITVILTKNGTIFKIPKLSSEDKVNISTE